MWRVLNYYHLIPMLQAEEELRSLAVLQAANPYIDKDERQEIVDDMFERARRGDQESKKNPYAIRDFLAAALGVTPPKDTDA